MSPITTARTADNPSFRCIVIIVLLMFAYLTLLVLAGVGRIKVSDLFVAVTPFLKNAGDSPLGTVPFLPRSEYPRVGGSIDSNWLRSILALRVYALRVQVDSAHSAPRPTGALRASKSTSRRFVAVLIRFHPKGTSSLSLQLSSRRANRSAVQVRKMLIQSRNELLSGGPPFFSITDDGNSYRAGLSTTLCGHSVPTSTGHQRTCLNAKLCLAQNILFKITRQFQKAPD